MIPPITNDLLVDAIQTDGMIRSGLAYFQQGRVSEIIIDEAEGQISARVRGSGRNRYVTSVYFAQEPTGRADSDCDCPIGYGCKHAAALLYAVKSQGSTQREATKHETKPGLRIAATGHESSKLSARLGDWLNGLDYSAPAARIEPEPVLFVIEPVRAWKAAKRAKGGRTEPSDAPLRYLLQIRARRRAGFGGEWRLFHSYEVLHSAVPVDPRVRRLMMRMSPVAAGGDFNPDHTPQGQYGWQWLGDAAAAGLLRWKSIDSPLVTLATAPLATRLDWRVLRDGAQMLVPEGMAEELTVIAGDPPMVFDPERHTLALIDTGLASPLAGRLLAMPPLGPEDIPALAGRWDTITAGAVPMPQLVPIPEVAAAPPRPVLRLLTAKLSCRDVSSSWYRNYFAPRLSEVARLEFVYDGNRVRAPALSRELILRRSEGLVRLSRDLAAEQAAVDRLAQTALVPIALHPDFRPKPDQAWDHMLFASAKDAAPSSYPELMLNDVPALEKEGWLIEYAPDWRHHYQPLDSEDPTLALNDGKGAQAAGGIDWFDVELAALVAGRRIDILPALRRLLADGGERVLERDDEYRLPVMLDKGSFTVIRLGTVRPLVEALLRLALVERGAGRLRLDRYDLGTLHDIGASGLGWAKADQLRRLASALHTPDRADFVNPPGLEAQLRPYQEAGVAWLQALHGAGLGGILADDMGLGKTLQAIAHILHVKAGVDEKRPGAKPVLIVAPTSVLPNWQAEIARFAPGLECLLWHGGDRQAQVDKLGDAAIVLTSYPLLARDKDLLTARDYALVVLDEAHVLKNPKTVGFKAAAALKANQTVALSGTPLENRLNDIWALASLTNPGLLGAFETFRKTYRTPIEKQNDRTAQAALSRRLRPFLLRRTKDEVAADLPAKTLVPERIELTDAQMRLYESQRLLMQVRVRQEIDRLGLMRSQIIVLDAMLKLRQICCDPELLPGDLGKGVASAKRSRLAEMLPELLDEGRRVIVFSQFTAMLDRIAADLDAAGLAYEQLRGTTRDRATPVRRFQEGEVSLILVSLKAGGTGINLTAADTVILYDPWWNPAVEAQAIDRAHRIGQSKPVFVYRLIATGTIEEKILALQERKQGLAEMLWSEQAASGAAALNDEDIAFLLG